MSDKNAYEVIVSSADLCGNTTVKRVGYSKETFELKKDYAFYHVHFKEIEFETPDVLVERAERMIQTGDWRG